MPKITSIDHFVLTVRNITATVEFYEKIGMRSVSFKPTDGLTRTALKFGKQKINLHEMGNEFDPKAKLPTAGSSDFCLITETSVADWVDYLSKIDIEIIEGPIARTGATGKIESIYVRDPDGNLVEISQYV